MRPGLPEWWDQPARFHEESLEVSLLRIAQERVVAEPVLMHLHRLMYLEEAAIETQPLMTQWGWAVVWNDVRKAIAEGLLNAQNEEHEAWLTAIDPVVGPDALSGGTCERRAHAYRCFCEHPSTEKFVQYMKEKFHDLFTRCMSRGFSARSGFYRLPPLDCAD